MGQRWTTQFKIKNADFYNLDTLIDNLYDYADTLEDEVDANAAIDAATIASTLADNYAAAMGRSEEEEDESEKLVRAYGGGKVVLSHKDKRYQGAPTLEVRKTNHGYQVLMSGKDVLYQEYGTGTNGKENPYPGQLPSGYSYGGGPQVLQYGQYKNGGSLNDEIPAWYMELLKTHKIKKSDMIWYSPRGITKGEPSGRFVYNTLYGDDEGNPGIYDLLEDPNSTVLKNGKANLYFQVKNKITKGLK